MDKGDQSPSKGLMSELQFEQEIAKAHPDARIKMWHSRGGSGILLFSITAGLAVIFFGAFVAITWWTYPSPSDANHLLAGANLDERLQAYSDLRNSWLQQTTSLGEMMVFGSLVPVLSTIIGFVFGRTTDNKS